MKQQGLMLIRSYDRMMKKNPLQTTIGTAGVLYAGGDLLCQFIEQKDKQGLELDWQRTARMALYGAAVFGISSHFWYGGLDKVMLRVRSKSRQVAAKVAADELLYGPFCIGTFFYFLSKMEGQTHQDSVEKVKQSFWPTFKVDVSVWPIAQTLNFYFLPPQFRVLYISVVSLFWNVFLSWMQNKEGQQEVQEEEENVAVGIRPLFNTWHPHMVYSSEEMSLHCAASFFPLVSIDTDEL